MTTWHQYDLFLYLHLPNGPTAAAAAPNLLITADYASIAPLFGASCHLLNQMNNDSRAKRVGDNGDPVWQLFCCLLSQFSHKTADYPSIAPSIWCSQCLQSSFANRRTRGVGWGVGIHNGDPVWQLFCRLLSQFSRQLGEEQDGQLGAACDPCVTIPHNQILPKDRGPQ